MTGAVLQVRSIPAVKRCTKCGATKPLEGFPPNRGMRDGRSSWCRRCQNAVAREWRERNPERVEAYNEARRVAHAPRSCVECGEDFIPNRVDRIVCSSSCRWKRKRRLKRGREATA